jgi:hypothetical protein
METRFIVAVGKVEKDGYTVKSQEHSSQNWTLKPSIISPKY